MKDLDRSKRLGRDGEKVAAEYLKKLGYRILARNFTCPVGELDLIALDGRTLVFAEVKTLRAQADIDPVEQVHAGKQAHIRKVARYYLSVKGAENLPARFDVLAVTFPETSQPRIEHLIDAF
jgi:putative endonuclease